MNVDGTYLCIGIAAGLLFNPEADERSVELSSFAKENGVKETLKKYSEYEGKYVDLIETVYEMFNNKKDLKEVVNYCAKISNGEVRV